MEQNNIPYFVFESTLARFERINRRLFILCIILILIIMGTNIAWIVYESSYEDVVVTQEATADGDSDIELKNIGGDYYGRESKTDCQD